MAPSSHAIVFSILYFPEVLQHTLLYCLRYLSLRTVLLLCLRLVSPSLMNLSLLSLFLGIKALIPLYHNPLHCTCTSQKLKNICSLDFQINSWSTLWTRCYWILVWIGSDGKDYAPKHSHWSLCSQAFTSVSFILRRQMKIASYLPSTCQQRPVKLAMQLNAVKILPFFFAEMW